MAGAAFFAGAVALAHANGLWINTTDSLPRGLWIETPSHGIVRGDFALICLPDTPAVKVGQARGYIASGSCPTGQEVVLKPVAAVPGDIVTVSPMGVAVNDQPIDNSAALVHDGDGKGLAGYPPGAYAVPPDRIWLVSSHNPRSFDSRYFGPVPTAGVLKTARPLWVFN